MSRSTEKCSLIIIEQSEMLSPEDIANIVYEKISAELKRVG